MGQSPSSQLRVSRVAFCVVHTYDTSKLGVTRVTDEPRGLTEVGVGLALESTIHILALWSHGGRSRSQVR